MSDCYDVQLDEEPAVLIVEDDCTAVIIIEQTGPQGPQGVPGVAASIAVGSTTTLAPGSSATVANSGTSGAAVFDFGIPEGVQGIQGPAGVAVLAINSQIANYVLVLSDEQKLVAMDVATANTLTVPPASSVAWTVGTMVHLFQAGDGQTTITPGLGVTISASPGLKTRAKFSAATLVYLGSDAWLAVGDLAA